MNLNKNNPIEELLGSAEKLLGVSITIRDWNGIFFDSKGKPYLSRRHLSHRKHPACDLGFCQNCLDHYNIELYKKIKSKPSLRTHTCWKGLKEIMVPLKREGEIIGLLFAGIWPDEKFKNSSIWKKLPKQFLEEYRKLPKFPMEKSPSITHLMESLATSIMVTLEEQKREKFTDERKTRILNFLELNSHTRATLGNLAKAIYLSPSRTSHLVKELFGKSFQTLLREERFKKAQILLLSSSYSIKEVAERVGIPDEFHFNRIFKKTFGMPPGRFRKTNRQKDALVESA